MRGDAWVSGVCAAAGVLAFGILASEVEAFREVALTLLLVAFVPLFIVVFAMRRVWGAWTARLQ